MHHLGGPVPTELLHCAAGLVRRERPDRPNSGVDGYANSDVDPPLDDPGGDIHDDGVIG